MEETVIRNDRDCAAEVGTSEVRNVWRKLLLDPHVLASAGGVLLLGLTRLPGSPESVGWSRGPAEIAVVLLILVALAALRGARREADGRVWSVLAAGYGAWLTAEACLVFPGVEAGGETLRILLDLGKVAFFYLVFVALREMVARDRGDLGGTGVQQVVDRLVGIPLFVGLLAYFVLVPARLDPSVSQVQLSQGGFYAALNGALALSCLVCAAVLRRLRYHLVALLLGLGFLGWGAVEVLQVVHALRESPVTGDRLTSFLWLVPFALAILANRVWALVDASIGRKGRVIEGPVDLHVTTIVVLVLPLLLAVFHITGYAFEILSPASRGARDVTVILVLVMDALLIPLLWALSRNERRIRALVDHVPEAILLVDGESGTVVHANPVARELLGLTPERLEGRNLEELGLEPDPPGPTADGSTLRERLCRAVAGGEPVVFEWDFVRGDGERLPCEVRISVLPELDHRLRVALHDIRGQKALLEEARRLSQALAQSSDLVMITDREGRIEWVNDGFVKITGYTREEAVGRTPRILSSGRHGESFFREMWGTITAGKVYRGILINRRKDGRIYHDERVITPLKDEAGRVVSFIATGRDVTGRMEDQARLQYLASHDVLTGLPNRAFFLERLRHALVIARRHRRRIAVVFLDLDEFKTLNDGLGHEVGDAVLKEVARSLRNVVRAEDTVARLGGDEFVVLAEEVADRGEAAALVERLCALSGTPLRVGGRDLRISFTCGVALFPEDGFGAEELLRNADLAMYEAKRQRRGGYRFYTPELASEPRERLSIGQLLPGAAARGELFLEYQPCFDLTTGRVVCLEALIRWQSPELGRVPPDRFIPFAEASGVIVSLGTWVLEEACRTAAAWPSLDGGTPGVSVNVASVQLEADSFTETLSSILERTGLPPWNLTLELTERLLVEDNAGTLRTLADCSALGVGITIDDFGTGYSSLAYLDRFPITGIKIDRAFVTRVEEAGSVPRVLEAIVKVAQAQGSKVVAEGVETEVQLEVVRRLGCDLGQGYLLGPPLSVRELGSFLAAGGRAGVKSESTEGNASRFSVSGRRTSGR